MKFFSAKDVLEANKSCYFCSKLMNFVFVSTSKNENGINYKSQTTKWDILRFLIAFPFAVYIFYDTLSTSLKLEKRSIIFEFIMVLNGKMQTIHVAIVMLQLFFYRNEYFKILRSLYWIDMKVFHSMNL